jgi:hypothetical protein
VKGMWLVALPSMTRCKSHYQDVETEHKLMDGENAGPLGAASNPLALARQN